MIPDAVLFGFLHLYFITIISFFIFRLSDAISGMVVVISKDNLLFASSKLLLSGAQYKNVYEDHLQGESKNP